MTTIGPYELLDRIGSGGMAEVWKARRCIDGPSRIVALKLLTGTRAENTQYRELFSSEARVSMLLNHANIVQVFDAGCDHGVNYIAMEWIEGLDLDRLGTVLRQHERKLDPKLVAFITGELLKALAYAHDFEHEGERLTLIHRDISPHNVMVSVTGEVKLMDFGVARLSSEETSTASPKSDPGFEGRHLTTGRSSPCMDPCCRYRTMQEVILLMRMAR